MVLGMLKGWRVSRCLVWLGVCVGVCVCVCVCVCLVEDSELWKLNAVWGAVGVVTVLALSLLTAVLCIK